MYKTYGDLYSTLTFGGTYAGAAHAEQGASRQTPREPAETVPRQRKSMARWALVCLGLLLVFPISIAKGVIAGSSAVGEAAAMALLAPHTKGAKQPK